MKDTLTTIATGIGGVGAVQIADTIPTSDEIQNYGQLFIQLIIGVFTILKMFKKKKKTDVSDQIQDK